jgi:hypothetical protein
MESRIPELEKENQELKTKCNHLSSSSQATDIELADLKT